MRGAVASMAALIGRDLRLSLRSGGEAFMGVGFFLVASACLPLSIGPEPGRLAIIAAGAIWVLALLASLLVADRLLAGDLEDGSLDLLTLTPLPLEGVILAKALVHWLMTGLPILIAAPLAAIWLNLPGSAFATVMVTLAIGAPGLSLLGALGSAITLGSRRGALLTPLMVLPLNLPVLIFAGTAIEAAVSGLAVRPHLLLLAAVAVLALVAAPLFGAAALREALR